MDTCPPIDSATLELPAGQVFHAAPCSPFFACDAAEVWIADALEPPPIRGLADVVITDPPYSRAGGQATGRSAAHLMAEDAAGSDQFWAHWFVDVCKATLPRVRSSGCGLIFCDYRTIHLVERCVAKAGLGWHVSQGLVWDRQSVGMGSPFRAGYEMIAFMRGPDFKWEGRRDMSAVVRHRWPYGAHANHPAEKPVGMLRELVEAITEPGQIILDPFTGSGSVLVAAKETGRKAIGYDREETHCRTAAARLGQGVLL